MQIHITGQQISGDDMDRAMSVPVSELPTLTEKQEKAAARMDVSPEKWARFMLAGKYSEARLKETAQRMAATVERELRRLVPNAEAEFFQYEVGSEPHRLMLRYKAKTFWVDIPSTDDSDEALVQVCRATAIMLEAD